MVRLSNAGANFGWPACEGPDCDGAPPINYSAPLFSIQHTDSRAIIMGPVYRGAMFPSQYFESVFIADFDQGWIRYITVDANDQLSANVPTGGFKFTAAGDVGAIVDLIAGSDGALYYVDIVGRFAATGGELRRVLYDDENLAPVIQSVNADITSAPSSPLQVNFTASAIDPEMQPLTYLWDFGDANQSSDPNSLHTYQQNGLFNAVLFVSDATRTSISNPIEIEIGTSDSQHFNPSSWQHLQSG